MKQKKKKEKRVILGGVGELKKFVLSLKAKVVGQVVTQKRQRKSREKKRRGGF